jgi:hypothetical protein
MLLNLPSEVWFVFVGAGAFFLFALVVLFLGNKMLGK